MTSDSFEIVAPASAGWAGALRAALGLGLAVMAVGVWAAFSLATGTLRTSIEHLLLQDGGPHA